MPEDWIHMGQKAKNKAIREWPELRDKIHKARVTRGLITEDDQRVTASKTDASAKRELNANAETSRNATLSCPAHVATWAERHAISLCAMEKATQEARQTPAICVPLSKELPSRKHRSKDGETYDPSTFSLGFSGVVKPAQA